MTRKFSDLKNLEEAKDIKKSGFKTKVHASPHKDEIDDMIVIKKWSSRMIVNELTKKYPKDNHPSDRGIDNYRKKYLPKEYARVGRTVRFPDSIREEILKQFDPAIEGIAMWNKIKDVLEKMEDMIAKLKVPPKAYIDLLKVAEVWYGSLCEQYKDLGLMERSPQSITLIEKGDITQGDVKATITKIAKIKTDLRNLRKANKDIEEIEKENPDIVEEIRQESGEEDQKGKDKGTASKEKDNKPNDIAT